MTQSRKIRRAKIIQAAHEDFCESGYDRARMENIARRAGIGKSTIYEYFPSKTELLLAVVEWGIDRAYHDLDAIFTSKTPIREIVNRYLEYMHGMAVSAAAFFMTLRNDGIRHFRMCTAQSVISANSWSKILRWRLSVQWHAAKFPQKLIPVQRH